MLNCCVDIGAAKKDGITFDQFVCLARCNGCSVLRAQPLLNMSEEERTIGINNFRSIIKSVSRAPSETGLLVVSYTREALGQSGDGHFSPIGGYHEGTDRVLIMDVARYKYPPHWVDVASLFDGMRQLDNVTGRPRGLLLMHRYDMAPDERLAEFHNRRQRIGMDGVAAIGQETSASSVCGINDDVGDFSLCELADALRDVCIKSSISTLSEQAFPSAYNLNNAEESNGIDDGIEKITIKELSKKSSPWPISYPSESAHPANRLSPPLDPSLNPSWLPRRPIFDATSPSFGLQNSRVLDKHKFTHQHHHHTASSSVIDTESTLKYLPPPSFHPLSLFRVDLPPPSTARGVFASLAVSLRSTATANPIPNDFDDAKFAAEAFRLFLRATSHTTELLPMIPAAAAAEILALCQHYFPNGQVELSENSDFRLYSNSLAYLLRTSPFTSSSLRVTSGEMLISRLLPSPDTRRIFNINLLQQETRRAMACVASLKDMKVYSLLEGVADEEGLGGWWLRTLIDTKPLDKGLKTTTANPREIIFNGTSLHDLFFTAPLDVLAVLFFSLPRDLLAIIDPSNRLHQIMMLKNANEGNDLALLSPFGHSEAYFEGKAAASSANTAPAACSSCQKVCSTRLSATANYYLHTESTTKEKDMLEKNWKIDMNDPVLHEMKVFRSILEELTGKVFLESNARDNSFTASSVVESSLWHRKRPSETGFSGSASDYCSLKRNAYLTESAVSSVFNCCNHSPCK